MPLVKLPIDRLKDKRAEITALADRMEAINSARIAKIVAINTDHDHTQVWKARAIEPLHTAPELEALGAQVRMLWNVIVEQQALWRDSSILLRDVAVPKASDLGSTAYTTAMAELSFLLAEASALAQNGEAYQAALDHAVLAEDWKAVYTLAIGRTDRFGRALPSESGLSGTPLDVLPLPGRDESEEIFHACELAKLRCDAVLSQVSSRDINATDGSAWLLGARTSMAIAERRYQGEVTHRNRLRAAPTALERWNLMKESGK